TECAPVPPSPLLRRRRSPGARSRALGRPLFRLVADPVADGREDLGDSLVMAGRLEQGAGARDLPALERARHVLARAARRGGMPGLRGAELTPEPPIVGAEDHRPCLPDPRTPRATARGRASRF